MTTIKKALKRKNKLIGLMKEELHRAYTFNSIIEGADRSYSAREALANWQKLSEELVQLKSQLQLANSKVYPKIFLMAELKSQVTMLNRLDCRSGQQESARYSDESALARTAEIGLVERNEMVKTLELQIELLQEELDEYNARTEL